MTPEGKVKAEIKASFDSLGSDVYYHMPVQGGYGRRTLDILACYKGKFIAIEVKRIGGRAKNFQLAIIDAIQYARGQALCVDSVEQVKELFDYVARPSK